MKYESGITAVFGANSEEGISVVQSVTDFFNIPYLFSAYSAPLYKDGYSVNVFPEMETLTEVLLARCKISKCFFLLVAQTTHVFSYF